MSPWAERLVAEIREVAPSLSREEIVREARRRAVRENRDERIAAAYVASWTFDSALIRMRDQARRGLRIESEL